MVRAPGARQPLTHVHHPHPEQPRTPLRRPQDDRWVAGVCSGLARELKVDPLVVRVAAIVLTAIGGTGIVLYVLGVLLIPAEGESDSMARRALDGEDRPLALGLALIAIVLAAVVSDGWFFGWDNGWDDGWGFGTLVVGGLIVWWLMGRQDRAAGEPEASGEPAASAEAGEEPTAVITPPRRRSSGRIALGVTLAGIAIVGAIGAIGGDDVRWDVLLASTVIALGAALVVAAPFGGARALIPLGLVLATGAGVAAAADLKLEGGAGERIYRPQTVAEIKPEYNLAAGRQEIDLRRLVVSRDTHIEVDQGFGELVVRLPEHTRVQVSAEVSAGEVEVLGRDANGFDADLGVTDGSGSPTITVDAHVGFGHIGIVRGDDDVGHRGDPPFGAITLR